MYTFNDTYTDTWNSEWTITSFDIPCTEGTSPGSVDYINNELHSGLLEKSLEIYDEIWTTLAMT